MVVSSLVNCGLSQVHILNGGVDLRISHGVFDMLIRNIGKWWSVHMNMRVSTGVVTSLQQGLENFRYYNYD